ncbi:MAG: O-antigen/teichoic acid export membrane protein [Luteibaculaceae bacterium]|jgi:O-antigen/teichoic acid export membrane protein
MKKWLSNDLVRNALKLLTGNTLALIIPFLLSPIISRLYTPEAFGSFEIFAKVLAFFAVVSTLRYELAIVIAKTDAEALVLAKKALKLAGLFAVLIAILQPFFGQQLSLILDNPMTEDLWPWLSVAIALSALFSVSYQILVRLEKFGVLASQKILSLISNQGTRIGLGWFGSYPLFLTLGHLLGLLSPVIFSFKKWRPFFSQKNSSSQQEAKVILRSFADFPKNNMPHALVDEGEKLLLLALVAYYFGALELGLFAFTLRYLRVPVQVLGTSIGQVLFPRFSKKINRGESLASEVVKSVLLLCAIGIIPFGLLFFFGEVMFGVFLGESWSKAGLYAEAMSLWLFSNFIISPISFLPSVFRVQKTFFLISIVCSGVILGCIVLWGGKAMDFAQFIWYLAFLQSGIMLLKGVYLVWISLNFGKIKHG